MGLVQSILLETACSSQTAVPLDHTAHASTALHSITIAAAFCPNTSAFFFILDCLTSAILVAVGAFFVLGRRSAFVRLFESVLSRCQPAVRGSTCVVLLHAVSPHTSPESLLLACQSICAGVLAVNRPKAGAARLLRAAREQLRAVGHCMHEDSDTAQEAFAQLHSRGMGTPATAAQHLCLSPEQIDALHLQAPRCAPCAPASLDTLANAQAELAYMASAGPSDELFEPTVVVKCASPERAAALVSLWNSTQTQLPEKQGGHGSTINRVSRAEQVQVHAGVLWESMDQPVATACSNESMKREASFWVKCALCIGLSLLVQGLAGGYQHLAAPSGAAPRGVIFHIGQHADLPPLLTTLRVSMLSATFNTQICAAIQRWCASPQWAFGQSAARSRSIVARAVVVCVLNVVLVYLYVFGRPGGVFWRTYAVGTIVTYPCVVAVRMLLNGTLLVCIRKSSTLAAWRRARFASMDAWLAISTLATENGTEIMTAHLGIVTCLCVVFSVAVPFLWLLLFAFASVFLLVHPHAANSQTPYRMQHYRSAVEVGLEHLVPRGIPLLVLLRGLLAAAVWPHRWRPAAAASILLAIVGTLLQLWHWRQTWLLAAQGHAPPLLAGGGGGHAGAELPPSMLLTSHAAATTHEADHTEQAPHEHDNTWPCIQHPLALAYGCRGFFVQSCAGHHEDGGLRQPWPDRSSCTGPWWGQVPHAVLPVVGASVGHTAEVPEWGAPSPVAEGPVNPLLSKA